MRAAIDEPSQAEVAHAIRRVLSDILRKTPAVNAEVAKIHDLLDGVLPPPLPAPGGNGTSAPGAAAPARSSGAAPADTGAAKHYEVRDVDGEPKLLEFRHGSVAPFAVPHRVYTEFAATTAEHSGKRFELIFRHHAKNEQHADAKDYQGRVCFRFWQQRGLLEKRRGRYAVACASDDFAAKAQGAWNDVSQRNGMTN